ncbi:MAG: SDR family oxidoreductase [Thermoanaerobaculia bacterium]|nr:MAG: SDR family oxidoreductase [Thermoanaerobaculia bacterium]
MAQAATCPWTLVTGASGGIGLELARCFAQDGHPLIVSARSGDRLKAACAELVALGAPHAEAVALDLAAPGGAAALAAEVACRDMAPGILVNNAGYGLLGEFAELDLDDQLAMLRLNVLAVVELAKRLLPGILAAGKAGGVLNVASTAAYQPGPYMAGYYASKAFVLSWSEALAEELAGRTRVTCLCPGPVPTGFQARAGFRDGIPLTSGGLIPMLRADAVARAGYAGFRRGRRVVVPGLFNRLGAVAIRAIPRGAAAKIVARLQRQRGGK